MICAMKRNLCHRQKVRNRNCNRNLKTYKALVESQAHQGTSLFTRAVMNQR